MSCCNCSLKCWDPFFDPCGCEIFGWSPKDAIETYIYTNRVKKVLEQLASHGTLDAEVARKSMGLLSYDYAGYYGLMHAFDNNGVELVVAALRAHPKDTEVQKQGAKALSELESFIPDFRGKKDVVLKRIMESDGLECIVAVMRAHPNSTDLQQELSKLLDRLLGEVLRLEKETKFDTVNRLGECGAIDAFTTLLRAFLQKTSSQEEELKRTDKPEPILRDLVVNDTRLRTRKVFRQFGEGFKNYDSENHFETVKNVLYKLLGTPENRKRFDEECEGTELVVTMMRTFKDDGKVYCLCIDLLELIIREFITEDEKQRAISLGVIGIAQTALDMLPLRKFWEVCDGNETTSLEKNAKMILGHLGNPAVPASTAVDLPGAISEEGEPHNAPGSWDYFISHYQKEAEAIAVDLFASLKDQGKRCWLDVKMDARGEAAMEEGVRNSATFIAVISEHYFSRPFCLKELDWAVDAGVPVQPVVAVDLKKEIGALLGNDAKESITPCPERFREIGSTDFITLDRSDRDYWDVGVKKILKAKPLAIKV